MKKTLVTILIVLLLVAALGVAGFLGFTWYLDNHVFVDGDAYEITTQSLDLTGEDISVAYYEELQQKLPNCEIQWLVPFHGGKYSNDTESLTVAALSLEDVEFLARYFPNLKQLDASQCDDYEVLAVAKATLPDCELTYYVNLGHPSQTPHYQSEYVQMGFGEFLAGEPDYNFDTLMKNLVYLPQLKTLKLENVVYSLEQVQSLREAYPAVEIQATVEVFGQQYEMEVTELDLSGMTGEDAAAVVEQLKKLPNLTRVNLTPENGIGALSLEDVKTLMDALPSVTFDFAFDFYGTRLSTADEEVHIKNTKIGEEGVPTVRNALDLLKNCKRFVLENCQISNETMAQLREDYRDRTKIVWRVSYGKGSTLTDAEIIRAVYDLVDTNCNNLIYCEDARFMDIGHNEWLDACDFVSGMKSLEYVIISGAPIKDLTPFQNCKNLKVLEAAFCEYIYSVEPLRNCTSLEWLNISYTHVTDLSPLDDLNLANLCAMYYPSSRVPQEEQDRFRALKPNCQMNFVGSQPYGNVWRYDAGGNYLPWYQLIRDVFRYEIFPATPNHVGWYLSEEEQAQAAEVQAAAEKDAAERLGTDAAPAETVQEETAPAETVQQEATPEETTSETTAVEENHE